MRIAMIGMGRMGGNMVRRLLRGGHECVIWDQSAEKRVEMAQEGAVALGSLEELKKELSPPRAVWIMLPSGTPTEETVRRLAGLLEPGDLVIDGGNSFYKDDVRRAGELGSKGISYCDVGVSGGVWGLDRGYCLMFGGSREAWKLLEPVLRTLAPGQGSIASSSGRMSAGEKTADEGYVYCGPPGAGHFVKMVHNGIEYGMMQSLAEGFDIMRGSSFNLDLAEIAEVWRRGSVVSSWLLDLVALALNRDPRLSAFEGHVEDSGEGRWTIQAAIEEAVPAPVLSTALFARFRSRVERSFADQLLSAMRNEFGGHVEKKIKEAS
jgi:6-phosphogluconate dehydrogenase